MIPFEFFQYGYLGLLAMMLIFGSRTVIAFINSTAPPKNSVAVIIMYFLLAIVIVFSGLFWAEKELESVEAKESIAAIIQSELTQARARLERSVEELINARNKALEQSVYGGNPSDYQEMHRQRALEIQKMIGDQEKYFENEILSFSKAFSSIDAQ